MLSPEEKNMNMSENERARQRPQKGKRQGQGEDIEKLSPAWRELLGLGEAGKVMGKQQSGSGLKPGHEPESGTAIPTVAGDPWVDLVHKQGVEEVDLQDTRLREHKKGRSSGEDRDVKQALDLMQEESDRGGRS